MESPGDPGHSHNERHESQRDVNKKHALPAPGGDEESANGQTYNRSRHSRNHKAAKHSSRGLGSPADSARCRIKSIAEGYPVEVPTPIRTRDTINVARSWPKPPSTPPASPARIPARNTRRGPNASDNFPAPVGNDTGHIECRDPDSSLSDRNVDGRCNWDQCSGNE